MVYYYDRNDEKEGQPNHQRDNSHSKKVILNYSFQFYGDRGPEEKPAAHPSCDYLSPNQEEEQLYIHRLESEYLI